MPGSQSMPVNLKQLSNPLINISGSEHQPMIWENGISMTIDGVAYQLSLSAGRYANEWMFKVEDMSVEENKKLLSTAVYFRFNSDKKYLSCFPAGIIDTPTANAIALEIKKHEDDWISGIRF